MFENKPFYYDSEEEPTNFMDVDFRRHGEPTVLQGGRKPDYETFKKYMEGEIDPSINREATQQLIENKVAEGKLKLGDYDEIVCSPARRARETADLTNVVVGSNAPVRVMDLLVEPDLSMANVSKEAYDQAESLKEVRKIFLNDFVNGAKVEGGEDAVDVYHRIDQVLDDLKKEAKESPDKKILIISHGIISRMLSIVITHQYDPIVTRTYHQLTDDQIKNIVKNDFFSTDRPELYDGMKVLITDTGAIKMEKI